MYSGWRQTVRPVETPLQTKLYSERVELERTAHFKLQTGLTIFVYLMYQVYSRCNNKKEEEPVLPMYMYGYCDACHAHCSL